MNIAKISSFYIGKVITYAHYVLLIFIVAINSSEAYNIYQTPYIYQWRSEGPLGWIYKGPDTYIFACLFTVFFSLSIAIFSYRASIFRISILFSSLCIFSFYSSVQVYIIHSVWGFLRANGVLLHLVE